MNAQHASLEHADTLRKRHLVDSQLEREMKSIANAASDHAACWAAASYCGILRAAILLDVIDGNDFCSLADSCMQALKTRQQELFRQERERRT